MKRIYRTLLTGVAIVYTGSTFVSAADPAQQTRPNQTQAQPSKQAQPAKSNYTPAPAQPAKPAAQVYTPPKTPPAPVFTPNNPGKPTPVPGTGGNTGGKPGNGTVVINPNPGTGGKPNPNPGNGGKPGGKPGSGTVIINGNGGKPNTPRGNGGNTGGKPCSGTVVINPNPGNGGNSGGKPKPNLLVIPLVVLGGGGGMQNQGHHHHHVVPSTSYPVYPTVTETYYPSAPVYPSVSYVPQTLVVLAQTSNLMQTFSTGTEEVIDTTGTEAALQVVDMQGKVARIGIAKGDVLLAINGLKVQTIGDCNAVLAKATSGVELTWYNVDEAKVESKKFEPTEGALCLELKEIRVQMGK